MAALAADLGVDESAISRWRRGDAMALTSAVRLCEVLDISIDWLLLGRGGPERHKDCASEAEQRLIDLIHTLPPAAAVTFAEICQLMGKVIAV